MLDDEHEECEPRPSLFPVVLATAGSLVVGYLFGRDRFRKDLLRAMDRAEQSPDPVEIHIREGL
jgi:hypothetical protein